MKKPCSVDGCEKPVHGNGLCDKHRMRMRRNGHLNDTKRQNGTGGINASGHISIIKNGIRKYEHVIIAERALGKQLPPGAQVHHADKNPANNENSNLVICQSDAYHKLLHRRTNAFDACGNANWRKCWVCKKYDAPENIRVRGRVVFHGECIRAYDREQHSRRSGA